MREALIWYLVVQVCALATWPLVSRALAPVCDRGWAAAKAVGPLVLAWLVWFVCMLSPLPFTRATLILAVLGIAGAGWLWLWRTGGLDSLVGWMADHRRLLLVWEGVFGLAFALFAVLR